MKKKPISRVKEAIAILNESAEEFIIEDKPKRRPARKTSQVKKIAKPARR